MKKYMILATKTNNDNLEVIDFDLTLEEAKKEALSLENNEEVERVSICEHGDFVYI